VSHQNERLILFDLNRLFSLEEKFNFIKQGIIIKGMDWETLVRFFSHVPTETPSIKKRNYTEFRGHTLMFNKNHSDKFLFFPPFEKPAKKIHFDFIFFRLGFPGISLAIYENWWAYIVNTKLNKRLFSQLANEYFPSFKAENGCFSYNELIKKKIFYSEIGKK